LPSKKLSRRRLTKPNLELLKLRKQEQMLKRLPKRQRIMLLPGKRGLKMPKRKPPNRWPKMRKRPS